jgi:hypothetical protein
MQYKVCLPMSFISYYKNKNVDIDDLAQCGDRNP